jgi:hypothetical protein
MRVFAHGRLHRFPSRTWERVLVGLGGQRVRRPRDADHLVFGIGAAARAAGQLRADLLEARERAQEVLSERTFLRRLNLLPALPDEARTFGMADLAARARLPGDTLELLVLFDIVEGEEGLFGFRALKAAGEAAKLLSAVSLSELAFAVLQLRDLFAVDEPLSRLQLTTDAEGRIALRAGDLLSDLDGQLRLGVGLSGPETAALLSDADAARRTAARTQPSNSCAARLPGAEGPRCAVRARQPPLRNGPFCRRVGGPAESHALAAGLRRSLVQHRTRARTARPPRRGAPRL